MDIMEGSKGLCLNYYNNFREKISISKFTKNISYFVYIGHIYVCVCLYVCINMCVCVCMCMEGVCGCVRKHLCLYPVYTK